MITYLLTGANMGLWGLLVKFLVNLTYFHHFSEQNGYFHPKERLFWSKHGLNFLIDMELVENGEEFRILIFQHQKQLPSSIISQINPTVRPHFQPAMVCRILKGNKWMDVDEKISGESDRPQCPKFPINVHQMSHGVPADVKSLFSIMKTSKDCLQCSC